MTRRQLLALLALGGVFLSTYLALYHYGYIGSLACGTGACAAVVAGIRLGWLDSRVDVQARGGRLTIEWAGPGTTVRMTGPAQTVFHGEIEIPE